MIITEQLLKALKTERGGYTKNTFLALGHHAPADRPWMWCPTKGWKKWLIGKTLDATQQELLFKEAERLGLNLSKFGSPYRPLIQKTFPKLPKNF